MNFNNLKVNPKVILFVSLAVIVLIIGGALKSCSRKTTTEETTTSSSTKASKALTQFEQDQQILIKRYGEPEKGYYWSDTGTRLALGDQNYTKQQVLKTFVRSLSTLDYATAQKYGYKSKVLSTVNEYFQKDSDFTYDEEFKKDIYQQALLSLEIEGIETQSTFADDKASISLKVKMLDLSYKDFWQKDKDELFANISKYKRSEGDLTKAREYVYSYLEDYWKSESAKKKEFTMNFTLVRTGEGGWLVSNDSELDNYCKYSQGIDTIMSSYNDWLSDKLANGESVDSTSDSDSSVEGSE